MSRRAGFTLLEVMVAIFVFAVIMGALLTLVQENLARLGRARLETEAARLAEALRHMEFALDHQRDPGISGITVSFIARASLEGGPQVRFVPQTGSYTRVAPIGGNRYRLVFIQTVDGVARMAFDEGTPEELEGRHASIRFKGERD